MMPLFVFYTVEVLVQLSRSDDSCGYSLQGKLLRNSSWTLSVWVDGAGAPMSCFQRFSQGGYETAPQSHGLNPVYKMGSEGNRDPTSLG